MEGQDAHDIAADLYRELVSSDGQNDGAIRKSWLKRVEREYGPEVGDYALLLAGLSEHGSANGQRPVKSSPWNSGSFYLVAFVIVVGVSVASVKLLSWVAAPFVLVIGLLGVFVIGILQLKNDDRITDKSFKALALEFLRRLPMIGRLLSTRKVHQPDNIESGKDDRNGQSEADD